MRRAPVLFHMIPPHSPNLGPYKRDILTNTPILRLPTVYRYSLLLTLTTTSGEVEKMLDVLDRMQAQDVPTARIHTPGGGAEIYA